MSDADLFMVTVVVPDMDDAIAHYTGVWGFALATDSRHESGHRWVVVDPGKGARLRLVEATTDAHRAVIGRQAGGRVAFFLNLTTFDATVSRWVASGVEIVEAERREPYGRIIVLSDKYGNRWDVFDAQVAVAA
jgi:predicted enzyme related to lactoylglutathione lyase